MTTLDAPASSAARSSMPVAVLIEPSVGVCAGVAGLLAPQGYEICIAKGVPEDLLTAAFALVEADRGARAIELIKRIRAVHPDLPIAGVLPWWDEDERDLAGIAQFILHVPVRDDQLRGLADLAAAAAPSRSRS